MLRITGPTELTSREYKVMLDHRMFNDGKESLAEFSAEVVACFRVLMSVEAQGKLKLSGERDITFIDTSDHLIDANRLLLRQRIELGGKRRAEYTLKCRSPDRFVAVGADLRAGAKLKAKPKLEEDIGPPFVSRFSQSNTVAGTVDPPQTLGEARRYFPILGTLERDGRKSPLDLELTPVNGLRVFERVYKGLELTFDDTAAEIAMVLWSDGPGGRPLVAEFSFRYELEKGGSSRATALAAMRFFERVQQLDWCLPEAKTKTMYAYRDT